MSTASFESLVHLEPLLPHHADAFADAARAAADVAERWLGADAVPRTRADARAFVEACVRERDEGVRYGFAVVERKGEGEGERIVGFAFVNGIHARHRFANLGYWIRPDAAGRGYATAAVRALAGFAFGTLGLVRAELVIEPGNVASRRVAEKAGAVYEGLLRNRLTVDGAARDALMFSLVPVRSESP